MPLCVLLSSERVRHTGSTGTRLNEAKKINASLSALGNVIAALAVSSKANKHVPYRDSKLTRLTQEALGGSSNTVLIATIGPAPLNRQESLSTLQFASRCMQVKANPVVHEEVDYADLCAKLQTKLAGMESVYLEREVRTNDERRISALKHLLK